MEVGPPETGCRVPVPRLTGSAPAVGNGVCLLRKDPGKGNPEDRDETEVLEAGRTGGGPFLLCARCSHRITHRGERTRVNGAHRHTFANPHGFFFHIGCFRAAPGCVADPGETSAFSWFAGYSWCIEACDSCFTHVGWEFRSGTNRFHALILDRLVEEKGNGAAG
jgi:hypothetical protein